MSITRANSGIHQGQSDSRATANRPAQRAKRLNGVGASTLWPLRSSTRAARRILDAMREAGGSHTLQCFADSGSSTVDADAADFVHTLIGKQLAHVVPHAAINVVAVRRLQVSHLILGRSS